MTDDNKKPHPYETLTAYRPERGAVPVQRPRFRIRGALLILIVAFVAIIWAAYPRGAERYQDVRLPIVRADVSPYKVRPDDRGGEYIPHQDSTVFEPMETVETPIVENILPAPEQPMPRDQVAQSLGGGPQLNLGVALTEKKEVIEKTVEKDQLNEKLDVALSDAEDLLSAVETGAPKKLTEAEQKRLDNIVAKTASAEASTPPAKPTPTVKPDEVNSKAIKKATKEIPQVAPKPALEAAQTRTPETKQGAAPAPDFSEKTKIAWADNGLTHYVQLGAYDSREVADSEYKRLSKKYGNIVDGIEVNYQFVDLGAKGTFNRIRLGPLTETRARAVCAEIVKINPGGCFVTSK